MQFSGPQKMKQNCVWPTRDLDLKSDPKKNTEGIFCLRLRWRFVKDVSDLFVAPIKLNDSVDKKFSWVPLRAQFLLIV